jgi:hypothetical protein
MHLGNSFQVQHYLFVSRLNPIIHSNQLIAGLYNDLFSERKGMIIFFKRLPAGTRRSDIEDFIADTVKGGLFSRRGQITNIAIIERPNPQLNIMDYHGVVTIEPNSVAERVIKKLNRQLFKGKYIEVRRYHIRNAANDPRKKNRNLAEGSDSRRKGERRQTTSIPNIEAIKGFNRKG